MTAGGDAAGVVSFLVGRAGDGSTVRWSTPTADVFGDAKYTADETFYDLYDRPFRPELHYYVGGNSKVYGAALLRLLPGGFGEVQHPAGAAPAWPLSYDDMATAIRSARHGSRPTRPPRSSTCSARRMTWTTCTWRTAASCPRSVR